MKKVIIVFILAICIGLACDAQEVFTVEKQQSLLSQDTTNRLVVNDKVFKVPSHQLTKFFIIWNQGNSPALIVEKGETSYLMPQTAYVAESQFDYLGRVIYEPANPVVYSLDGSKSILAIYQPCNKCSFRGEAIGWNSRSYILNAKKNNVKNVWQY